MKIRSINREKTLNLSHHKENDDLKRVNNKLKNNQKWARTVQVVEAKAVAVAAMLAIR